MNGNEWSMNNFVSVHNMPILCHHFVMVFFMTVLGGLIKSSYIGPRALPV